MDKTAFLAYNMSLEEPVAVSSAALDLTYVLCE